MNVAEIAEILGCSKATVRNKIRKGMSEEMILQTPLNKQLDIIDIIHLIDINKTESEFGKIKSYKSKVCAICQKCNIKNDIVLSSLKRSFKKRNSYLCLKCYSNLPEGNDG